jgi:hypothetical protein
MESFADKVIKLNRALPSSIKLPAGIKLLQPYLTAETLRLSESFYRKFYNDNNKRILIFGINPGRYGAGITGIAFTDPVNLKQHCGIENDLPQKHELSSVFVYKVIDSLNGVNYFFRNFYLTAVCPLGFIRQNKNLNYYDDKKLEARVTPFITESIKAQLEFGVEKDFCFCWGEGKNFLFLNNLNRQHQWFKRIISLPHPRWIMQYRRKKVDEYVEIFRNALTQSPGT